MRISWIVLCVILSASNVIAAPAQFAGDWQGILDVNGVKIRVIMHLVNKDGVWSGTDESPDQTTDITPYSKLEVKDKTIYWEIADAGASFEGKISKDGNTIVGSVEQGDFSAPLTYERVSPTPESKPSLSPDDPANRLIGDWAGTLAAGDRSFRFAVQLVNTGGTWSGTLTSLDEGAQQIPFSSVKADGSRIHFSIDAVGIVYDGTMSEDGKTISGTWSQGATPLPLNFVRGDASASKDPNRPQEPKPPFPYRAEDVAVPGPGGITLAGTLTVPNGNGPFPVVVLATGSGASDRDESGEGHKPFLVLADYLTRQGIAVLRLDDRGVGKSTGDFSTATTETFAQDALAEVAYLKTRKEIDPKQIGLAGHSEGGMIAPIAASRSADVAFVVMLAGPAVPAGDVLSHQVSAFVRANGAAEVVAQSFGTAIHRMCQITASTSDPKLTRTQVSAVADSLTAQITAIDSTATQMISQQAHGLGELIMSPWFRYWLTLKLEETLRQVKQPLLAINGSLDLNVSARENLPVIEKALRAGGNKDVTIVELPGLNHLFQTATTGSPMEYATIEETMSPLALKTISDWILARTSPKKP